ncbi:hypothetical protein ACFX5U_09175 [Sphingobacterium sp. SG20118]|uniref:hypothetical protein n=1 Tax=Sphingobacterium sp. SG20118 TaxID=3367156 RepID=UPI0037DFC1E1
MKKMILLLTLFCGMLSAHNVLAQELKDYVITMKGDTIYGEMGSVKSKKVYMLVKGERKVYFPLRFIVFIITIRESTMLPPF